MPYDIGDLVRCTGTFKNTNETPTDPTTVTVRVKDPSGNVAAYVYGTDAEVVKSGTGIYYIDVTPDEAGIWRYRFSGTGTVQTDEEGDFVARKRRVAS